VAVQFNNVTHPAVPAASIGEDIWE
jgi:hypothetical protein